MRSGIDSRPDLFFERTGLLYGSVEDVDLEAARRQLDTNFFGVLRVLRAALPGMREAAARGTDTRVVLVGSLAR